MAESPSRDAQDLLRSHLQDLQRAFAERLPGRIEDIRSRHRQLAAAGWNLQEAEALHRLVHSLTGAAGTFGMRSLSDTARHIEAHLARMLREEGAPDPDEWAAIGEGIDHLGDMALARPDVEAQSVHMPLLPATPASGSVVHLVMDDRVQAGALQAALAEAGHRVTQHRGLAAFRRSFAARSRPETEAVVIDLDFPAEDPAGARLEYAGGGGA